MSVFAIHLYSLTMRRASVITYSLNKLNKRGAIDGVISILRRISRILRIASRIQFLKNKLCGITE